MTIDDRDFLSPEEYGRWVRDLAQRREAQVGVADLDSRVHAIFDRAVHQSERNRDLMDAAVLFGARGIRLEPGEAARLAYGRFLKRSGALDTEFYVDKPLADWSQPA